MAVGDVQELLSVNNLRLDIMLYPPNAKDVRHNVLWISRHKMLPIQLELLKKKLGAFRLYRLNPKRVSIERILMMIKERDISVVIPIMPLSIVSQLVQASKRMNFIVLKNKVIEEDWNGKFDPKCMFVVRGYDKNGRKVFIKKRFIGFEVVKDIKYVLRPYIMVG